MASPSAKYSNSASSVTSATASASNAVEPHKTSPTAKGINTAAVATRFQVIEMESPKKSLPSSHHIERNKSRTRVGQTFLSVQITESRETLAQRACFVASRKLRRGGAAGQPAAHRVAISVVGRAKRGAEMRFFVQDYKEMGEQEPWQSEKQDCGRLFVQAEAKEHNETADVHRIARELVWTGGDKLARWIERRGRAFPARDKRRHAGEREDSTGSHQRDAQSARPAGQLEAQSAVIAIVQA